MTRCRRGRKGDVLGDGLVRESKYGEAAQGAKCICTMRFGVRLARYATFKGLTCLVLVLILCLFVTEVVLTSANIIPKPGEKSHAPVRCPGWRLPGKIQGQI